MIEDRLYSSIGGEDALLTTAGSKLWEKVLFASPTTCQDGFPDPSLISN
jgi:hypothetical protein